MCESLQPLERDASSMPFPNAPARDEIRFAAPAGERVLKQSPRRTPYALRRSTPAERVLAKCG
jgi:hypothetical protein